MARNEPYREIIDFLLEPAHVGSAFDLAKVWPLAVERLEIKFWRTLKGTVEQKLMERGVTDWEMSFTDGKGSVSDPSDPSFLEGRNIGLELTPAASSDRASWNLYVEGDRKVEQSLGCGLYFWSDKETEWKRLTRGTNLPQWAKTLRNSPPAGFESSDLENGWLVYYDRYTIWGRDEIVRIAKPDDDLEKEIADSLFVLFDKTHKDIEAENGKIGDPKAAARKGRGR